MQLAACRPAACPAGAGLECASCCRSAAGDCRMALIGVLRHCSNRWPRAAFADQRRGQQAEQIARTARPARQERRPGQADAGACDRRSGRVRTLCRPAGRALRAVLLRMLKRGRARPLTECDRLARLVRQHAGGTRQQLFNLGAASAFANAVQPLIGQIADVRPSAVPLRSSRCCRQLPAAQHRVRFHARVAAGARRWRRSARTGADRAGLRPLRGRHPLMAHGTARAFHGAVPAAC
jgi:hypothetical protein